MEPCARMCVQYNPSLCLYIVQPLAPAQAAPSQVTTSVAQFCTASPKIICEQGLCLYPSWVSSPSCPSRRPSRRPSRPSCPSRPSSPFEPFSPLIASGCTITAVDELQVGELLTQAVETLLDFLKAIHDLRLESLQQGAPCGELVTRHSTGILH